MAPLLPGRDDRKYWDMVRIRAAELGTDGCTKSPDIYVDCCYEHDIHWRTGRTLFGDRISEADANNRLRQCQRERSWMRRWFGFSPIAGLYWLGVTVGALFHRHPTDPEEHI